jgi:hypothetical protein
MPERLSGTFNNAPTYCSLFLRWFSKEINHHFLENSLGNSDMGDENLKSKKVDAHPCHFSSVAWSCFAYFLVQNRAVSSNLNRRIFIITLKRIFFKFILYRLVDNSSFSCLSCFISRTFFYDIERNVICLCGPTNAQGRTYTVSQDAFASVRYLILCFFFFLT